MRIIFGACFVLILLCNTGCTNYKVDNYIKWCEQVRGDDLEKEHKKPWTVFFSVSFDKEAIQDDFVKFLNSSYMEKMNGRRDRMVWRNGNHLHIINLSGYFIIEPEKEIDEYRKGIDKVINGQPDYIDRCLFGTITALFDDVTIHSEENIDGLGHDWKDTPTVINYNTPYKLK